MKQRKDAMRVKVHALREEKRNAEARSAALSDELHDLRLTLDKVVRDGATPEVLAKLAEFEDRDVVQLRSRLRAKSEEVEALLQHSREVSAQRNQAFALAQRLEQRIGEAEIAEKLAQEAEVERKKAEAEGRLCTICEGHFDQVVLVQVEGFGQVCLNCRAIREAAIATKAEAKDALAAPAAAP